MVVERLSTSPKPITHLYPPTELVVSHKNNLEIFIRWNFYKPVTLSISFIHLFYCLLIPPKTAQCHIQSPLFPAFLSWNIAAYHSLMQKVRAETTNNRTQIIPSASLPATFNLLLPSQAAARALWLFRADSTVHSHICTFSCLPNLPSPAAHNKTQIQPISPLYSIKSSHVI